jgi:hypothetical protein
MERGESALAGRYRHFWQVVRAAERGPGAGVAIIQKKMPSVDAEPSESSAA